MLYICTHKIPNSSYNRFALSIYSLKASKNGRALSYLDFILFIPSQMLVWHVADS